MLGFGVLGLLGFGVLGFRVLGSATCMMSPADPTDPKFETLQPVSPNPKSPEGSHRGGPCTTYEA